ncbi:MAG: sulfotransferase domain-containing protein [Gammaproteobacteria bacterium]
MSNAWPVCEREYVNTFMDSRRWAHFKPRPDDIIVCTPYKSGTTWTQMLCALLIFQTPELPRPLAEISPWLDMQMAPVDEVIDNFERQQHRRIIKTHTPLDGLPYYDAATYVFCGRDPRDIFISMQNHGKNQNLPYLMEKLRKQGMTPPERAELPEDVNERFKLWLTRGGNPWEEDGYPYWSVFAHAKTFWDYRHVPNIHFLHYADLKQDLAGQMRRLSALLKIAINSDLWPTLVEAATFESMKRNADMVAPDTNHNAWKNNASFFNKGENEQWRDLLRPDMLRLYETVRDARAPDEFGRWLENGFMGGNVDYC